MSELIPFIFIHGNKVQKEQAEKIAETFKKHLEYGTAYILKTEEIIRKNDKVLPFNLFNSFDFLKDTQDEKGFRPRLVVQGQTNYLNKFHCHTSTLSPKAGYEPHDDSYDVVIIVLEGEVETLGQCVGPCGVIFYAAGEPHGIRNPGDITAKYLVFEFHT